MLDREELVGERIKIKGDASFYNPTNDKYPTGRIYQKIATVGTGIKVDSEHLQESTRRRFIVTVC